MRCYFRLVVLVFAWLVRVNLVLPFPKNIFGLKTEGQQFASAELEANSVVCLVPLGQQHCSPGRLICSSMRPRAATARQNSISPHFPVNLSLCPDPFLFPHMSVSLLYVFRFLGLSFSISLSLSITVFNIL